METPPPFQRVGLGYVYTPAAANGDPLGIVLRARYLQRRGEGVSAELTLETTSGQLLDTGTRHNLSSMQTRQSVIKHFISLDLPRIPAAEWQRLMVTFCASIMAAERRPTEMIRVGRLPRSTEGQRYLLWPLLAEGKINGIHGDGGTGKGWIATLAAVLVQTHTEACGLRPKQANVLYLDWEEVDTPLGATANERIAAVAAGLGIATPEICYQPCRRALRSIIEDVGGIVDSEKIGLVIIDSVEMASGAGDENASYEQRFLSLLEAIRELGPVTALLIDHVSTATATRDREPGQVFHAFGSRFKHNEIRWSWEQSATQELNSPHLHVALLHDKRNNAGRMTPLAFDIDFSVPGAVSIKREILAETDQATKLEVHYRIEHAVTHSPDGALTTAEITDFLVDIKEATIRKTLVRFSPPKGHMFVHLSDGRWAATPLSTSQHGIGPGVAEIPQLFTDSFGPSDDDELDSIPF